MGCVGEIRDRVRRVNEFSAPPKVEVGSCDELLLCIFFFGKGGRCTCGLRYRKGREVLCQRLCTELYIVVRVIKTSECETVGHVRCCFCWGGASSLLYTS